MLASVSSVSGIPVLGRPPSWRTLKFAACFVISHSSTHNSGRAANFTDTTFAKREFAVNTKSVKTTLSNTHFLQITKSNQDVV
jgi:hypothetical protein